ncbi:AraC family transcriptional regulator [Lacibacter sp.]|uniref:helix-turn-helix domain-containing protein n=1 Tax=Lacibacter sp. TaxID=1915409 RepID=UPI002B4B6E40|nr:AraC family transcriptional regulator [Lacibacter sp.]HLP39558.1 AraC family transcriptional regulator [Lacibacter sp.]
MKRFEKIFISKDELIVFSDLKVVLSKQTGFVLTMRQLVKMTGMNRTKLSTGFLTLYGCSIKQYQLQQRIQLAKRKLVITNLPVKAIAKDCGFTSEKNFFAYFKQKTGMPPGMYRKRYTRTA